jgi:N-acyl-D-amino-acid deacylase
MHEVLIQGGSVVDGTGAPARTADIAIEDGRIVEVGRITSRAKRTIDADGLLVTPGFVDIHTHYDGQATWDPHLTPSSWHGVTTAILGNCGVGFAPVVSTGHERLIEVMEGVEDIPGTALAEGIRWDWQSFPECLDALERMPRAVDVGAQLPHAALRTYVMGERDGDPASAEDVAAMCQLARESMAAGAMGFSTGRTAGHRDVKGGLVPGTLAALDELDALLGVLDEVGHGVFQLVPAGIDHELLSDPDGSMENELDWLIAAGLRSSRPITFLVMQGLVEPDSWRPWFGATRAANAKGAHLYPQVASRCFGMLMGLQSRMNPLRHFPTYQSVAQLPLAEQVARLRDPQVREAILSEQRVVPAKPSLDFLGPAQFKNLFALGSPLDYEPDPARSVANLAAATGASPWEITYDLMLQSGGQDFLLYPLLNYGGGNYDGLYDMINDPMTVQGLGDGGAHCGIVCDASMTTYLLSHWARDRSRGKQIGLEQAVQRLTGDPAALYGLSDRGQLTPGRRADINLIDFDRLNLVHPELVRDLPAGAGRLVQRSTGYVETLVAGETIVAAGELTDARPGKLLRGGAN